MKGKIQGIIGLLIIGIFVFGFIRSLYNRNFAAPELKILNTSQVSSPLKNVLFWYEQELEKTSDVLVNTKLSVEESSFIQPLYDNFKNSGMVSKYIKTMSEKATQRMIELNAYRGTEPDVWEMATQNDHPYIFKIAISNASAKKRTSDLESVKYKFSLYSTSSKSLIWEAESTRLAGFLGGMPKSEATINVLNEHLKEAGIIYKSR